MAGIRVKVRGSSVIVPSAWRVPDTAKSDYGRQLACLITLACSWEGKDEPHIGLMKMVEFGLDKAGIRESMSLGRQVARH